jgi:hypothetical protein
MIELTSDYEFVFPGKVVIDEGPGHILGVPVTKEMVAQHAKAMGDIALAERQADEDGHNILFC